MPGSVCYTIGERSTEAEKQPISSTGGFDETMKQEAAISGRTHLSYRARLQRDLKTHWTVYLLFLPVLAWYILFKYVPLKNISIAFYDYNIFRGLEGSKYVGFKYFQSFFESYYFVRLIRNTFLLSILDIAFSFPAPIILALMINEVKNSRLQKTMQTISYMPHFVSIMVVCGMLRDFCSTNGMFNLIRGLFGLESYNLLSNPGLYRTIHIGSGVWQTVGWNSIIYLATISTIDPQQYEAAYLDGANVLQRILHITLPALLPIISVQFIMRIGNIMSVGYEKVILLSNSLTLETADVISSYLYRTGILKGKYSMATAVGLFNSLINIIILVFVNKVFDRTSENGLW